MEYDQFRTGMSFGEIYEQLWEERRRDYRETGHYKGSPSRAAVLGKWRAIKLEMYDSYLSRERGEDVRDNSGVRPNAF